MTKTELISAVALKAELTKKDSEKAVAAVFDTITEALVAVTPFPWSASASSRSRTGARRWVLTPAPRSR